jgi:homospermidine synthase
MRLVLCRSAGRPKAFRFHQCPIVAETTADLLAAVCEEFRENEEPPNTTNLDDWAQIAGKKGERIIHVKSLVGQTRPPERTVDKVVNTGQYL